MARSDELKAEILREKEAREKAAQAQAAQQSPESFLEQPHALSRIRKVIGIVSGKGGVGKSMVTALMASQMSKKGTAAVLDADITGPSIPKMFGITGKAMGSEDGILPRISEGGVQVMSMNLLLDNEESPVVWRGPVLAGVVKQFWTDVIWNEIDYMFVDMPPGTGDVPLTVFQSIPLDDIIVVTSPQELVGMIVTKAVNMAEMMDIPVLGIVENMSYFICPDCSSKHYIFGDSHIEELAEEFGIDTVVRIPINPALAKAADEGRIEKCEAPWMDALTAKIESL